MKLIPGYLVTLNSLVTSGSFVILSPEASISGLRRFPFGLYNAQPRFHKGDVALVVSLGGWDGSSTMVMCGEGYGWTFGAYLDVISRLPAIR